MLLKDKFIRKYMRLARQVGLDSNPCYSRQLGTVLVRVYDDGASKVLGTGYNGPPKGTPHCDTEKYLRKYVLPQLTYEEMCTGLVNLGYKDLHFETINAEGEDLFLKRATGCQTCPRKLIGAASGERTDLCSCSHAEQNAIINAGCDLHGAWAFCWCGVACLGCARSMINAGIKKAFFIDDGSYARNGGSDYSFGVRWLFEEAGVEIDVRQPEFYLA